MNLAEYCDFEMIFTPNIIFIFQQEKYAHVQEEIFLKKWKNLEEQFENNESNEMKCCSLFFAVHSLPHLTVLSLSGCSKVTDDGIELIAENLQKLRALDLSWCPRITDASLEYIACDLNQLEELTLDR